MVVLLHKIKIGNTLEKINNLSFSSDGKLVANSKRKLSIIDIPSGDLKNSIDFQGLIAISSDYTLIAESIYTNNSIEYINIIEIKSGKIIKKIQLHRQRISIGDYGTLLDFTPDNKHLVIVLGITSYLLNIETGLLVNTIDLCPFSFQRDEYSKENYSKIRNFALTKGEQPLLATGGNNQLNIWNLYNKELHGRFNHDESFRCDIVAFSPDGDYVFSGDGENYSFKIWRTKDGLCLRKIDTNFTPLSIDSNRQGQIVVGGTNLYSEDKPTMKIYDFSGKEHVAFGYEFKKINYVSFSPDGKILAAASNDGNVNIWKV